MAFKLVMETEIPFIEGSVIKLRRLDKESQKSAEQINDGSVAFEILFKMVVGWDGIEDVNGKALEVNDYNKHNICMLLKQNKEFLDLLATFMRGPLGNSKAGSTASLTIDGTLGNAVDASNELAK
jgi:hypothetical protein